MGDFSAVHSRETTVSNTCFCPDMLLYVSLLSLTSFCKPSSVYIGSLFSFMESLMLGFT